MYRPVNFDYLEKDYLARSQHHYFDLYMNCIKYDILAYKKGILLICDAKYNSSEGISVLRKVLSSFSQNPCKGKIWNLSQWFDMMSHMS